VREGSAATPVLGDRPRMKREHGCRLRRLRSRSKRSCPASRCRSGRWPDARAPLGARIRLRAPSAAALPPWTATGQMPHRNPC